MWTGVSALKNIEQTLQTIRNDVVRLDTQLTQLTERLAASQRHRLQLINEIVGVRIQEIEQGSLREGLNSADRQAQAILLKREAALATLNELIESLNTEIDAAEQLRLDKMERLNEFSQQIVEAEAAVQQQLNQSQPYLDQLSAAKLADSIAEEADRKVENSQTDMAEKAKPYQADRLFMYLWERAYGTTEYQGGLFGRFMDGFVARTIDFEPARVNFWNLTEIPKRLAEHADTVNKAADEQHMAVQQLEINALQEAGVPSMEEQLNEQRTQLDLHDDSIEALEEQLNQELEQRAMYVAGEDSYIKECFNEMGKVLNHQDLDSINRYVRATNSIQDDKLLIELQGIDRQQGIISDDLKDVRNLHDNKLSRLKELEQVRRKFKDSRFDDVRSGFGNESLLAGALGQFLQGVVSGSDLWRVIQRNQRYRDVQSTPDFGSGSLGSLGDLLGNGRVSSRRRRKRQSSWHIPTPRRGGGGFNFPSGRSSGGSKGGGFKTGGGF